jgi:hypothetical protein
MTKFNRGASSMSNNLGYGPRLTDEEYEKKIIALHRDLPPVSSRVQERQVRRLELDLSIDHRLGRDFPRSKREALWAIQQQVEKKRGRLLFKYLLRKLFERIRQSPEPERVGKLFWPRGSPKSGSAH